jgi:acyl-CoA synthetase (AMP-forming)/AMP-acid ligase II/acyl carrier protein
MNKHPFPTAHRPGTVIETLDAWRERSPHRTALTILRDGETAERTVSFGELHALTTHAAAGLSQLLPRGARVLLLLPTGLEFVCTFYGCLAAGMVAVPAPNPQQPRKLALWQKLAAVVQNSGATMLVVPQKSLEVLLAIQASDGLFEGCQVCTWEDLLDAGARVPAAPLRLPRGDELAFLQYTSGSTGLPKGVMLTHTNILSNQEVIAGLMGHDQHTRVVSWLPLYHDMGLSAVLQLASLGCSLTLLSPLAFVEKPLRWLRAITEMRASTSGGPNFAYRLAAEALRSPEATDRPIDLSSWEVAFCGAEPINPMVINDFVQAAAPHGFRAGAFHACYGMAEATVQVTGARKGCGIGELVVNNSRLAQGVVLTATADEPGTRRLVSCGGPHHGHEVRIVGPDGAEVPDSSQVGEIWVRGPSVGAGYYGNPEASQAAFGATLQGDAGGPFLRTGDLGVNIGGELYVTGRLKDLLIIRGRNLYPQDVEDCVQDAVPGLRRGCGAAFTLPVEDEERLVIVQEIGRTQRRTLDLGASLRTIATALGDEFGVTPHRVVLVEPATIEKTSSGKIARALCRRSFLQGDLRVVASWPAEPAQPGAGEAAPPLSPGSAPDKGDALARQAGIKRDIEAHIAAAVAVFLKIDAARVSRTTPWNELGFDSVNALQLALRVQEATGLSVDATALWERTNIEELAMHLASQAGAAAATARASAAAPATAMGSVPASTALPVQAAQAARPAAPQSVAELAALSDQEAEALLLKELEH